ncbi:MAG TPA: DUF975 family protein [Lachnospiraceae bacterium]|nr:DUF975 family protein [Lachnospiraceae bacterium]
MNTYLSSAQLKDKAKYKLTGHYGLLIGISLLVGLISFFVSIILLLVVPSTTFVGTVISECISFIISVFIGVFFVGTYLIYLKLASGNTATLTDLFYGFSHNIQRSLAISLVLNAVSIIPTLAYIIPYQFFLQTRQDIYLYLMFPCLAIALVVFVPLYLGLSQCYYLMLDFPSKSASDILTLSFNVMKGHKARLFYIEISFIPLVLLGIISGLGMLWITPYMRMTMTNFFFDIMKTEQKY